VLGLIEQPVAIRTIEQAIADRGFAEGWIAPQAPTSESGRRVAVIGSGPAGLAAAQQLRRLRHGVAVFEKADRVGGLLRYGFTEFKLEKTVLDRRVSQLAAEGVQFRTNAHVGQSPTIDELQREYDAILLAMGAETPRELQVPGRVLSGIELAMNFLVRQNRRDAGDVAENDAIDARDKHVVIIGGGDTGSDCAGTCIRQGARSVRQFELLPQPPKDRADAARTAPRTERFAPTRHIAPACPACSRRATSAAARRSSCGRSARDATQPPASTRICGPTPPGRYSVKVRHSGF